MTFNLVHLADQIVNQSFTITSITSFNKVEELALTETTVRGGELEGPQEVGGSLEVGSNGKDLVDQIFHTNDSRLSEVLFNDAIVSQSYALAVDFTVSTLINKFTNALQVGLSKGDEWLDDLQHLHGGAGQLDENTIVDLTESQQLQDLAGLGGHLVDTLDTDNKGQLGSLGNVHATSAAGNALHADLLAFLLAVLLDVRFSALELIGTLGTEGLALLLLEGGLGSQGLFDGLALLQDGLGNGGKNSPTN